MFLAMLSHELRNPLSAVLSASHVLGNHRASASDQPRAIATIQRQSTMIASLLDDLLDVSRISLGKIELSLTVFNLVDLAESIRETTLPQITSHQATLYFDFKEKELFVEADWARLIQVHVNLIHNAAKYSPPGSPIFVTMYSDHENAIVTVRDEGSGISPDFLPRIFEPFVQSDHTLDRSEGGLGVGLTLVKSLMELHGGTIEAFSDGRGSGSTFVLQIPLTSLRPSVDAVTADSRFVSESSDKNATSTKSSKCIVLVEDIDDIRDMLKAIMELDGHQVTTAADGESGYDVIRDQKPDVAVIDIGLPGMDGYEVARRVRQDAGCKDVRMIALTGYGQQSDIAHALAAGFDAHLVKPIDPDALASIIDSFSSLKKQRKTLDNRPVQ
jgi:two-component system CheB/CheR fusion protein